MTTDLTPAAVLDAQLRADEKRALVFCDWALGSAERGSVLAATWLAQWHTLGALNAESRPPTRGMLWRTLLTRLPAHAPEFEEALPEYADLAGLAMPARTAVLLALLGLTQEDSAEAMRLSMHAHSERLGAGLPRLPDGSVDGERWQAWSRAITAYLEHLTPDRTTPLVQARLGGHVGTKTGVLFAPPGRHQNSTRRNLLLVGVACATLIALTFVPSVQERFDNQPVRIETRTLEGLANIRASTQASTAAASAPLEPVVEDLAFYAWYARQRLHDRPTTVLEPLMSDSTPNVPESEDAP